LRKGRWPGGKKSFIYSQRVINGGASDERVRVLWMEKVDGEDGSGKGSKRRSELGVERKRSRVESGSGRNGGSGDERTWDGRRESRRPY
jgi:hypothetical protein